MDIGALKVFKTVADLGSISKAAHSLNYVQSNVTMRIQQLEEELGVQLLYRHSRGITLTSHGKTLLEYAEKILFLHEEAMKAVQESSEPKGTLSIGVNDTTATLRLPSIISSYYEKYPQVEFKVIMGLTKNLVQDVLQFNVDAAFVDGPIEHPELSQERIFDEELVLIANKQFISYSSLSDIKDRTLILQSKECSYRSKMERWLHEEGLMPLKIMVIGSFEGIMECVKVGMGVSLVPMSLLASIDRDPEISCIPIPEQYGKHSTVLIRRSDLYMTTAMRKFVEMV